jgi:hypothetical protein
MVITDPALAAYDRLLVRYQAEPDSTDGVVAAQNIVERLIADDVFGRLAALRVELLDRMADETRDRQLAVEYTLDVLADLLGTGE